MHCACHAKGSRGPSGGNPQQQLVQAALCTAPATQKRQPRPQRRPRAPQLVQDALCTAPATRQATTARRYLREEESLQTELLPLF